MLHIKAISLFAVILAGLAFLSKSADPVTCCEIHRREPSPKSCEMLFCPNRDAPEPKAYLRAARVAHKRSQNDAFAPGAGGNIQAVWPGAGETAPGIHPKPTPEIAPLTTPHTVTATNNA